MGKLARVPLHRNPNGYTTVEPGATVGAALGVNFTYNGVLVRPEDILNSAAVSSEGGADTGSGSNADPGFTYWRLIQEIPPNVVAVADLSGTGVVRRTGDSTFDTSATTSDLPEGGSLYFTSARSYAATKATLKPGANVTIVPNDGLQTLTISSTGGGGGSGDGVVLPMIAATTIHGGRAVASNPDEVYHPELATAADGPRVIGIATQSVTATDPVDVRTSGPITDPAWSWVAGPVFVGDAGVLSQTAPATGWVVSVGNAISSNTIDVNVKLTLLRG